MDHAGKVTNPTRGSAEQGKGIFPCPCSRLRILSRETGSAVPSRVSLLILHTQAESGSYLQSPDPVRDESLEKRACAIPFSIDKTEIHLRPKISGAGGGGDQITESEQASTCAELVPVQNMR